MMVPDSAKCLGNRWKTSPKRWHSHFFPEAPWRRFSWIKMPRSGNRRRNTMEKNLFTPPAGSQHTNQFIKISPDCRFGFPRTQNYFFSMEDWWSVVLSNLDGITLRKASCISRNWRRLCSDDKLWEAQVVKRWRVTNCHRTLKVLGSQGWRSAYDTMAR